MGMQALDRCKAQVLHSFSDHLKTKRVFQRRELGRWLTQQVKIWGIDEETRTSELIEFLIANEALRRQELKSESGYPPITRFSARRLPHSRWRSR